ncbi:MAG: glucose-1-phosphate adenylyltransferase, partial [Acidobacteria bacterium]|nr:glucose-1-phosphate adenylyltransferase [Acidobacteriota bacterium]
IVLAGGAGERLAPLTRERAKPAVYFGGPYRIIDFVLSNSVNSGLRRIFIATQYKSLSLARHIRMGWSIVSEELGEFIEILPPQKRVGEHWYLGTADAVYQNLYSIEREAPRHVVVLAGDHVYKMDDRRMLRAHEESGAAVTLATIEVPVEDGHRFGIVAVDGAGKVVGFDEKPKQPAPMPGQPHLTLASMGVYVFDMDTLAAALERDASDPASHHDFGKNIIPALIRSGQVFAYAFYDENKKGAKYWRDIGTLDAYYEANMDLCRVNPEFNLYDPEWPMRTHQPQAPPAKFVFADAGRTGTALDSIISPGCIVSGSRITGSILCPNVRVHSFASVADSILMPGVQVGRHARIRNAIIDRDVLIPRGALIGYDEVSDRARHTVTDRGIVVVTVDEEPRVVPIDAEALALEAGVDRA